MIFWLVILLKNLLQVQQTYLKWELLKAIVLLLHFVDYNPQGVENCSFLDRHTLS